ncbi:MAG: hypothetical protein JSW67_04795 [Candidatus Latescibacterota bacterium]|nr:MAG: hypothetical protein JSW67_04795 [Candidatus Latescibacterota bacterium]
MDPKQALGGFLTRRPWLVPLLLLLLLTLLALLDPREPRTPFLTTRPVSALDVLGSIEPNPENPVESVLRVQWNTFLDANAYEVRFFSLDMQEVSRHPAGTENTVMLDLQQVWKPVAPARAILWRVVALRDGEDVAASSLQTLRLP